MPKPKEMHAPNLAGYIKIWLNEKVTESLSHKYQGYTRRMNV
jgi:hypothetical protein